VDAATADLPVDEISSVAVSSILRRLDRRSRVEAAQRAGELGLLP
jgi:hypothetical protein